MLNWKTGNDLLSRLVSKQVSSALKVFTSVFGMRTGVTPLLISPVMDECLIKVHSQLHIHKINVNNYKNLFTELRLSSIYMIKPSTY